MSKVPIKSLLLIFGLIAFALRLFYFSIDSIWGTDVLDGLIICFFFLALILFTLTIIKAFKKDFKPLAVLIVIVAFFFLAPFEYLLGWTKFKLNEDDRKVLVKNVKNGVYDDLLTNEEYSQNGIWIEDSKPRFKIFKDSSLQMLFIWQGHIRTHEEYCGQLYLSDTKQIESSKVYGFLGRDFRKKYLGNNWYWVDCFIDRTPGP